MWSQTSPLQPLELLGGHSLLQFLLNNNNVMQQLEKTAREKTRDSLFMVLMKEHADRKKVQDELIKYTQFIADPLEVPYDLRMRNAILTCLEFEQPLLMYDQANQLLEYVLKQPRS